MEDFLKARSYVQSKYKELMSLYSMIYTQLEVGDATSEESTLAAITSYYTVVSNRFLKSNPMVSVIQKFIKNNGDKELSDFDSEVATTILTYAKVNDLEKKGLVRCEFKNGEMIINLTEKGKEKSKEIQSDVRFDLD